MTRTEVQIQGMGESIQKTQAWLKHLVQRVDKLEACVEENESRIRVSLAECLYRQGLLISAVRRMSEGKKPHILPLEINKGGYTAPEVT